jgi:DNA modification methylase
MADGLSGGRILAGDCRGILPRLEARSVQCCVTSPPYWGLRDYGTAEWEGGSIWCEHVVDHSVVKPMLDGRGNLNMSCTSWTTRADRGGKMVCQCGARRIDAQLGLEATPEEYIANMVAVFREVWRVLREDGTLWVNMGDSYATSNPAGRRDSGNGTSEKFGNHEIAGSFGLSTRQQTGLKPKDLCMMPARLALALQADGWYLRSEIVWAKPNPMPESVTDRPTKAHEMIYLLAKNGGKPLVWRARDTGEWSDKPDLSEVILEKDASRYYDPRLDRAKLDHKSMPTGQVNGIRPRGNNDDELIPRWKGFDYFYDAEAIREPLSEVSLQQVDYFRKNGARTDQSEKVFDISRNDVGGALNTKGRGARGSAMTLDGRNKRSVWTIATQPYAQAHFATFPEEIPKLCILAGSKPGDTVLDPFAGTGTVGQVALELGRRAVLIELNPAYIGLAHERTFVTPGFL